MTRRHFIAPQRFHGHMADLDYWGLAWGTWLLFSVWTRGGHLIRIDGPQRSFQTREYPYD